MLLKNKTIFLLAEARSGSSWLMETLDSHKKMTLFTELYNHKIFPEVTEFHNLNHVNFTRCIEYLDKRLPENNQYFGCKILFNQLDYISKEFAEYFISHFRDAYFIILLRENMLEAQISLKIAHMYNVWHCKKIVDLKKRKLTINTKELYINLELVKQLREKILEKLNFYNIKKIELTYEQLFREKKKVVEGICKFLNLSPQGIKFSIEKKGNPFPMDEIIINYSEVKRFLRQYPYYYGML